MTAHRRAALPLQLLVAFEAAAQGRDQAVQVEPCQHFGGLAARFGGKHPVDARDPDRGGFWTAEIDVPPGLRDAGHLVGAGTGDGPRIKTQQPQISNQPLQTLAGEKGRPPQRLLPDLGRALNVEALKNRVAAHPVAVAHDMCRVDRFIVDQYEVDV